MYVFTGIAWLAVIVLIVSLGSAFVDTIWSVYMQSLFKNIALVSFFSAFLTIIAFLGFFILVPIIERTNKSKLYICSLVLIGITYVLFALNKNIFIFTALALILTLLTSLKITSFGIIIRDKSRAENLSRNEGLMYTFLNIAWVIGPLIAGYVSEAYGIHLIFLLAAIFILIAGFIFKISKVNDSHVSKKIDTNVIQNFRNFFKDKNRTKAYIIGGGIYLWLILIYLYMPLFILDNGLNNLWIGYFLFAFSVPLIIFEYGASKLAGKIGFKSMFKIGFFILFASAVLSFLLEDVYAVMGILVAGAIGAAILEPTIEAYFFDVLKTKDEEAEYYGPYNTTIDVSQFLGKALAGLILLFLPFKFIFLFFALFMFAYFLFSFRIKEIKECLRKKTCKK